MLGFPVTAQQKERSYPPFLTHFGAQSHSGLLPNCLRLTYRITPISPRLATGGLALAFPGGISTH